MINQKYLSKIYQITFTIYYYYVGCYLYIIHFRNMYNFLYVPVIINNNNNNIIIMNAKFFALMNDANSKYNKHSSKNIIIEKIYNDKYSSNKLNLIYH